MSETSPQSIANILWGFAKLSFKSPAVLQVCRVSTRMTFSPQGLANTLWTFGALQVLESDVFTLVSSSLYRMPEFSQQNLANIM